MSHVGWNLAIEYVFVSYSRLKIGATTDNILYSSLQIISAGVVI